MILPRFASALSTDENPERAEREVSAALAEQLNGRKPDLLVVFTTLHAGPDSIGGLGPRLSAGLGAERLLGCTAASVLGSGREPEGAPGLSVLAACMPETHVRPFAMRSESGDDGQRYLRGGMAVNDPTQAGALILGDPFSFPAEPFLRHVQDAQPGLPLVGGMASGGRGPGQDLLFTEAGLQEAGALGCVIEGRVALVPVVSQGCRPVGEPFVVTAAENNAILKLGGRSAYKVLEQTLAELPDEDADLMRSGNAFVGLAVDPLKSQFERGDFLARGLLGILPQEGGLAIADHPRRGQTVQFLVRDAESAGDDLRALVGASGLGRVPSEQIGALMFTCNGRGQHMFGGPDHDITALADGLDGAPPSAGLFAAGEIGPVGGQNFLHGFTASIALLAARDVDLSLLQN